MSLSPTLSGSAPKKQHPAIHARDTLLLVCILYPSSLAISLLPTSSTVHSFQSPKSQPFRVPKLSFFYQQVTTRIQLSATFTFQPIMILFSAANMPCRSTNAMPRGTTGCENFDSDISPNQRTYRHHSGPPPYGEITQLTPTIPTARPLFLDTTDTPTTRTLLPASTNLITRSQTRPKTPRPHSPPTPRNPSLEAIASLSHHHEQGTPDASFRCRKEDSTTSSDPLRSSTSIPNTPASMEMWGPETPVRDPGGPLAMVMMMMMMMRATTKRTITAPTTIIAGGRRGDLWLLLVVMV